MVVLVSDAMRFEEIDCWGDVCEYRPGSHKTEHHGKQRVIFMGPEAQKVIKPFLCKVESGFIFRQVLGKPDPRFGAPFGDLTGRNPQRQ